MADDDTKSKIPWGTIITVGGLFLGFAIQWGANNTQINANRNDIQMIRQDMDRRVSQLEQDVKDRMLSREEYDKRHEELQKRLDKLESYHTK